ncbi:MAG: hypothetical protein ACODAD_00670 [Planctomycetota bacterium]
MGRRFAGPWDVSAAFARGRAVDSGAGGWPAELGAQLVRVGGSGGRRGARLSVASFDSAKQCFEAGVRWISTSSRQRTSLRREFLVA